MIFFMYVCGVLLFFRYQLNMRVAIIKSAGNILSVVYGLQRIGIDAEITSDTDKIRTADKVIFPGVGQACATMAYLHEHHLDEVIVGLKQPVLGICIGLQIMCAHSEEGNVDCLGIFDEEVKRFNHSDFKIPQIGWNTIQHDGNPLFSGLTQNDYVYYVHSYYVGTGKNTIATTNYIHSYSAALQKNNFYAVQFHPEKSGTVGEKILQNFIEHIH